MYNLINNTNNLENIYNKINLYINKFTLSKKEENIKQNVVSELTTIGYNWKYKGSQYMLEAILFIIRQNNMDLLDNLEQNVYRNISNKYKKSINNIKTNIIKATNYMNNDNIHNEKFTPKQIITTILTRIAN